MKKTTLFFFFQMFVFLSCQQTPQVDDPQKLKTVMESYFNALGKKNFEKMKELTTSDFVCFEDGKIFSHDSLVKLVSGFSKFSGAYTLNNFKAAIDTKIGTVSYHNHGEFMINDSPMVFNWLESANLKKFGDEWKIELLHSSLRK